MTIHENLAFPLQVRKLPKDEIEERVRKALNMVELGGFGTRRPAQLSGGQQQRVAVARALVFEPQLVLMDEPLGALDKQLREQMQYEIKHIHESLGVTVVYVTHDQSEALTMSNRIAVFNDGIIQQLASPDALYEQPENAFVAQFIGENNKLIGTVKEQHGTECLVEMEAGGTVTALAVNNDRPGTRTTLSLRPERVFVRPEPGSCPKCSMPRSRSSSTSATTCVHEFVFSGTTTSSSRSRTRPAISISGPESRSRWDGWPETAARWITPDRAS